MSNRLREQKQPPTMPQPLLGRRIPGGIVSGLRRAIADLVEHDAAGLAAEIAYRCFVAIIPGLLLLSAATGFVMQARGGMPLRSSLQREIERNLPPDTAAFLRPYLNGILSKPSANLLSLGILLSFWTMSSVITTVMKASARILRLPETRTYLQQRVEALVLSAYLPILLLASMVLTWFRTEVRRLILGHAINAPLLFPVMRIGAGLLLAVLAIMLLLHFAAPQSPARRTLLAGALITVAGIWLVSELFALYAEQFIHYRSAYGLLGGTLALVTWLYLCAFCLLGGLEVMALLRTSEVPEDRR